MKRIILSVAIRTLTLLAATTLPPAMLAVETVDETLELDTGGILKAWSRPTYPEPALEAGLDGRVDVYFIVDESGAVSEAKAVNPSDPVFAEPAVEAVRRWKFEPPLKAGKPAAVGMNVPVVFSIAQARSGKPDGLLPPGDQWPRVCETIPAKALYVPDPGYPDELRVRKLAGQAELEVVVGPDGRVSSSKVTMATHAAFVVEALRACGKWRFEPAMQGLLAVPSMKRSPATFESVDATSEDVCRANGIQLDDPDSVTEWPEPVVMPEPAYPFDRLVAGGSGFAEASFTIGMDGLVQSYIALDRSEPEFGDALAAAVQAWVFRPGTMHGQRVLTRVKIRYPFHASEDDPLVQLARKAVAGEIAGARGLDSPIQVVWRAMPVYPESLKAERLVGDAQVEIIIDKEGRARLPRVVSATKPEFGLAAATALNQWVFAPPRKGGEPTEVRARVPLHFTPGQ